MRVRESIPRVLLSACMSAVLIGATVPQASALVTETVTATVTVTPTADAGGNGGGSGDDGDSGDRDEDRDDSGADGSHGGGKAGAGFNEELKDKPGKPQTSGWNEAEIDKFSITAPNPPFMDADYIETWIKQTRPQSPLADKGEELLKASEDTGVPVAMAMGQWLKETELGTTGPGKYFNFGCMIAETSKYFPDIETSKKFMGDREWVTFNSAEDGISAWFNYVKKRYVDEGLHTYKEYLDTYSPQSDNNDHNTFKDKMWAAVTSLGYDLSKDDVPSGGGSGAADHRNNGGGEDGGSGNGDSGDDRDGGSGSGRDGGDSDDSGSHGGSGGDLGSAIGGGSGGSGSGGSGRDGGSGSGSGADRGRGNGSGNGGETDDGGSGHGDGQLKGKLVYLDPGHAGTPPPASEMVPDGRGGQKQCNTTGTASADGYTEHEFNWEMVQLIKKELESRGAKVELTRNDDTGRADCIDARAKKENESNADAVVSVHADGNDSASARGFHVIAIDQPTQDNDEEGSVRLAKALIEKIDATGLIPKSNYLGSDGLDRRSDLAGLNMSTRPKALIEFGNMRQADDIAVLKDKGKQEKLAGAVADAVAGFVGGSS